MYVSRNIEARSRNHRCRGKAISNTYSEFVSVALVIQRAKRMRRITLLSVACPALTYFSSLFHKRYDFRYYCLLLVKVEFSRQMFEKHSDTKFRENPSSGNRAV